MVNKQKPSNREEIMENNVFNSMEWEENITVLDLSNREIANFDESVKLPENLIVLNLSNNKLTEVPNAVLKLDSLKILDLSSNNIELFDDTPNFCHTLESLNLSKNKLHGPPYWVWADRPANLVYLNISDNDCLCKTFICNYLEELLLYTTLVHKIDIYNCKLGKHLKFLSTLKNAKVVNLGTADYNHFSVNHIEFVPCAGLEDCRDIEVLNLCNTNIYNIQNNIDIFKYLREINLSENHINSIPNEFCNLENLEICILSYNKILYLPGDMFKMKKLTKLYLDNNELCMLPELTHQLESLKVLDLYNNHLYEGLDNITCLEQYDFAQNYNEEPNHEEYYEKRTKLRKESPDVRLDGRAPEIVHAESEQNSIIESCDEEEIVEETVQPSTSKENNADRCSSPEDWDSDDYWIPSHHDLPTPRGPKKHPEIPSNTMKWLKFVQEKIDEGKYCPIDMHHQIAIEEMIRLEKLNNPQPPQEVEGQFDDYSDDDS